MKSEVNRWDFKLNYLKAFAQLRETINKIKRQPSKWEKITANKTTDKGLISKIYRQLMQLNTRKTNNPYQKMGRRPKETFLQRRHTRWSKTHEKMFNITHY